MIFHGKNIVVPQVGIVLGSGLGAFADELQNPVEFSYEDLEGWPRSTAIGHAGKLIFGKVSDIPIVVMAGRFHLYEGYTAQQAAYGVREMAKLGTGSVILTNAAGGINLNYSQGALVLISDHINLQGTSPLIGPNDDSFGPRFPDMTEAYSKRYRQVAKEEATALGIHLEEGVYAGLLGPSYETPAEIRYLRAIGADLVGMSTVPEVIAANHLGMKCLGISTVTNMAAGITDQKINHDEVLSTGKSVRQQLVSLLTAVIPKIVQ